MASQPPPTLTAVDLMTADPRTCSAYSTVLEAVLIFRDADCGAVPVLADGKPTGIVTDRDVALALAVHGEQLAALPISEIMTRGIVAVGPTDPLDLLLEKIGDEKVRRLLVVDSDGRLLGIVSWADLAPHITHRTLGETVDEVLERR